MDSSTKRHRRIAGFQARFVGIIVGAIMAITAFSGIMQVVDNHQASNQATEVAQRADFWRVIAGTQQPGNPSTKNKLAFTLRDKLGPTDPNVSSLPAEVEGFRAGPNDFGGIEGEINLQPFDSTGMSCSGCGSLNSTMKTKLLLIKQGKVQTVLNDELAAVPAQTIGLTPFNLPNIVWLGFVYAGSTVTALMLAVRRDSKANNYRASLLDWEYDGGSVADRYRRTSKLISPLYFVTVLPLQRKFNKEGTHREVLEAIGLAESDAKCREALEAINALPVADQYDPGVIAEREKVESLLEQIDHQVTNHTMGENPGATAARAIENIQVLTRDAADTIEARAQSSAEVDDLDAKNSWMTPNN